jgi:hypothetical protein
MKNNQLPMMLVFVLLLSALFSAWLTHRYTSALGRIDRLQITIQEVRGSQTLLQSVVNDTVKYSETHPAILPILQGLQQAIGPGGAPARPATK